MDKLLCPNCSRRLLDASQKMRKNFKFKGIVTDTDEAIQIKCPQCKNIISLVRIKK